MILFKPEIRNNVFGFFNSFRTKVCISKCNLKLNFVAKSVVACYDFVIILEYDY